MSIFDHMKRWKDDEVPVNIFLINGIKLEGVITEVEFDGLEITRDGQMQYVAKHAIATVLPK